MADAAALNSPNPHTASTQQAAGPAFAMITHPGRTRAVNQDACAARPQHGAFVVCDGVGGSAAGEVASHLAAQTFLDALTSSAVLTSSAAPLARLHQAVVAANHAVLRRAGSHPNLQGMGTTLVAALLENAAALLDNAAPTLSIAHVGDSRCYRLRRGTLELLTQDHSLVEEQVRAGLLTPQQALTSPIRNIITRAIGAQPEVEPALAAHPIQSGDLYLLASDGLTRELADVEIARILTATLPAIPDSAGLQTACQALVDAANHHGGRDNITVLLLACP